MHCHFLQPFAVESRGFFYQNVQGKDHYRPFNANCISWLNVHHHHHHHSLLVQLTYRSRTQGSFKNLTAYTMSTSENSVTVFIQRSCNEVFCTQMTDLCWKLSVVRASSQMVVLRCCGLWREEYMQCVS